MLNFFIKRIKKHLISGFSFRSGTNYFGRKTIFTQSGGYKFKSRFIDFKRVLCYNAMLISIEKDIGFTGLIGLICYENGFFSYILLSMSNIKTNIVSGFSSFFRNSSSTLIMNVPTGNFVHHIELIPGKGGQICRAAGCSAFTVSKDFFFTYCKMRSG
jgi:large subunit ribosomal protein L2